MFFIDLLPQWAKQLINQVLDKTTRQESKLNALSLFGSLMTKILATPDTKMSVWLFPLTYTYEGICCQKINYCFDIFVLSLITLL